MKRIRRLLYAQSPNGSWASIFAAVILMAGAAVALAAWQPKAPQARNAPESTFSKWLNQDVVYIIADEERAAFERLTTDSEREMFIQQFWQSDRGHIYIAYGPADELEAHPGGAPTPYAYQTWKYRHVEGIGDNLFVTFVDRNKTGDYQLAPAKLR